MDTEKQKKIELFEKYKVPKAIITLCTPTVLSMLATVVYNMVDTFFIGMTKDPYQVAAIGLSAPVFLLLMALGNIFGLGGGSYISRMLGKRDYEEVLRASSFSFYTCIGFSVLVGSTLIIFLPQILHLLGTSGYTYQPARGYLFYIALGAPAICLSITLSSIIRSEGAAKHSMIGVIIGTIANIILDPIMILNMGHGVKGAAIATVIANILTLSYYIFYLIKKTSFLTIALKYYSAKKKILRNVFLIGTPISFNNILMSISFILLNNIAAPYGDNVIAGISVALRVSSIIIMFFIGVSQGLQPFVAYNYSAKNTKRMNSAIKFTLTVGMIIALCMSVVGIIFSSQLIAIFIDNEGVIKYGVLFLRAACTSSVFIPILFVISGTFQAMGKAKPAFLMMISRQGFIFLPTLLILNSHFGENGIFWAQPTADFLAAILAISLYIIVYRKVHNKEKLHKEKFYSEEHHHKSEQDI